MRRQFLIAGVSLLIIVGLAGVHLGCGLLDNTHTITVVNETSTLATFGFDDDVHSIPAGQSIKISEGRYR